MRERNSNIVQKTKALLAKVKKIIADNIGKLSSMLDGFMYLNDNSTPDDNRPRVTSESVVSGLRHNRMEPEPAVSGLPSQIAAAGMDIIPRGCVTAVASEGCRLLVPRKSERSGDIRGWKSSVCKASVRKPIVSKTDISASSGCLAS